MSRVASLGWLLLAVAPVVAADPPRYRLEQTPVSEIEVLMSREFVLPKAAAEEWFVVAPVPPNAAGQRDVKMDMTPTAKPVLADQFRLARVVAKGDTARRLPVKVTYRLTLLARKLVELEPGEKPPAVPPLTPAEHKRFTGSGGTVDPDHEAIRKWLKDKGLTRRPGESDVALARRVYDAASGHVKYDPGEDRPRSASAVCNTGRGDCGGIAALFCAALRANGVPARVRSGRWATSVIPGQQLGGIQYYQTHCKTEFYARGVGWVPADPTAPVVGLERTPGGCFGADAGDFVTLSFDTDFDLTLPRVGKQTVGAMQGAVFWYVGQPAESSRAEKETWQVTVRKDLKAGR